MVRKEWHTQDCFCIAQSWSALNQGQSIQWDDAEKWDIPKSDRSRTRPLPLPSQMVRQNIAAVWIEPRKASVCGCCCVVVWFKEKVYVLRVRLRLFTNIRLPIAFSRWSEVVLLFGCHTCPPAMWRERRKTPVDNECDFCKCWLPVYKCVHIFSYEHCSPLQPVSPLTSPFVPNSPGVINEKTVARETRRALQ